MELRPKLMMNRMVFLLVVLVLTGAVGLGTAGPAVAGIEPNVCDTADDISNLGADPYTIYHCEEFMGVITWVPVVTTRNINLVYNDATYGKVFVSGALTSGAPIRGFASVDDRGPGGNPKYQPAGELRVNVIIQKWNGSSWVQCVTSGYYYNGNNAFQLMEQFNMGSSADCGSGTYRTVGRGHAYDSGVWRGGSVQTPGCVRSLLFANCRRGG